MLGLCAPARGEGRRVVTAVLGGFRLVEDVAAELGVAASTMHQWIRAGRFPARRAPFTRRYLIPADELQCWLNGDEMEVRLLAGGGRIVRPKKRVR